MIFIYTLKNVINCAIVWLLMKNCCLSESRSEPNWDLLIRVFEMKQHKCAISKVNDVDLFHFVWLEFSVGKIINLAKILTHRLLLTHVSLKSRAHLCISFLKNGLARKKAIASAINIFINWDMNMINKNVIFIRKIDNKSYSFHSFCSCRSSHFILFHSLRPIKANRTSWLTSQDAKKSSFYD